MTADTLKTAGVEARQGQRRWSEMWEETERKLRGSMCLRLKVGGEG